MHSIGTMTRSAALDIFARTIAEALLAHLPLDEHTAARLAGTAAEAFSRTGLVDGQQLTLHDFNAASAVVTKYTRQLTIWTDAEADAFHRELVDTWLEEFGFKAAVVS